MENEIAGGIVAVVGLICGYLYSRSAFEKAIAISDVPTPPQYLVRRRPFLLGETVFVAFCLGVYAFALIFYRELPLLVQLLPPASQVAVTDVVKMAAESNPSLLAIALAITIAFFHFLEGDFRGNFIYSFRTIVYSSISVPFACARVQERLLNALVVPTSLRIEVANNPALGVALSDFSRQRPDIKRRWAELSAMYLWVESNRATSAGEDVISDPSFAFEKSANQFIAAGQLMLCNRSGTGASRTYAALEEFLEELRSQYSRYVACLLLTQASNRREFYASCKEVGIDLGSTIAESPLKYSALYIVTLAATVVLGPYLCAAGYDLMSGKDFWSAIGHQKTDYIQRWLIAGIGTYFSPIFFVLLVRNLAWRVSPDRTHASLVTYAWILLGAFGISIFGGVAASIINHPAAAIDWDQLTEYLHRNAPWSIGPALIAVYINYYLDRQADPAKEDIVQTRDTILPRLASVMGFTGGILLLTLLIVARQHFESNLWAEEKARVIVLGTVVLITFSLCLIAQFGLLKSSTGAESRGPAPVADLPHPIVAGAEGAE